MVLQSLLPMLVVDLSLFVILKDVIRIIDVMKLVHSVVILRVLVRVVLHCQFAIGLLDLTGGRVLTNAKDLVEITSVYMY